MAEVWRQMEDVPGIYPPPPTGATTPPHPDVVWSRIENYIAYRWTTRQVKWIVEGPGEWVPPLAPIDLVVSIDIWDGSNWQSTTPDSGYLGGYCLNEGKYRFVMDIGNGSPPGAVNEAYLRLAKYMAETDKKAGASSYSAELDILKEAYTRSPSWMAKAMQNSGAADLLRPYRRVS